MGVICDVAHFSVFQILKVIHNVFSEQLPGIPIILSVEPIKVASDSAEIALDSVRRIAVHFHPATEIIQVLSS